jgi:hypothetical protein
VRVTLGDRAIRRRERGYRAQPVRFVVIHCAAALHGQRLVDVLALCVAGDFSPRRVRRLDEVIAVVNEDAGCIRRDFLDAPAEGIVLEGIWREAQVLTSPRSPKDDHCKPCKTCTPNQAVHYKHRSKQVCGETLPHHREERKRSNRPWKAGPSSRNRGIARVQRPRKKLKREVANEKRYRQNEYEALRLKNSCHVHLERNRRDPRLKHPLQPVLLVLLICSRSSDQTWHVPPFVSRINLPVGWRRRCA